MTDFSFAAPDPISREEQSVAPYAMRTRLSRGRRHAEEPHPYRTLYQRDRDRIIHSTAFRRLMYKTQVLVAQTNDHHRTRLTHTLEVAQISRTIARQLGLNEDLTEAIALAHDLGHPPFGHAGETALDQCMKVHGGFEHNRHGLRILEFLEYRYPNFPGLNLSLEVLEAQALHSKRRDAPEIREFAALGQPLLEAQVVDAADSLAYNAHDIDDALSIGIITTSDLEAVPMWREACVRVAKKHAGIAPPHFQPAMVRTLIDWQVGDLLEHSRQRLQAERISCIDDVRKSTSILVGSSPAVRQLKAELEQFLHQRVYRHHRVLRMAVKGQRLLEAMFAEFCRLPRLLPERYSRRIGDDGAERVVCDYLAGMTDRFAQDEYQRLFQPYSAV
ncbi:MAG TPA: deoxyguanosinetriphosphate triphosphohydrolase [Gemmataceae bacterium]|nr:deoxyguanosinetriphosphate triphosphohydrolase [Gemmataceae bacterium]